MSLANWAAGFCIVSLTSHLLTLGAAGWRLRRRSTPAPPGAEPAVSVLLPVCGVDNFAEETLASGFRLDYPDYELIFCIARPDDPAVPLVRQLIESHPHIPSRLLVGDDRISRNPKLNNLVKGWNASRLPWVAMVDSNVVMPPDYIRRLFACWRTDTGAVCSMPIGDRPHNFWAELECAFLNTLQARYQYVAESLGFGFAQGKTMLVQRELVERAGGIRALAGEDAEDAALTKLVRAAGLRVHLVDTPVAQPLGWRSAAQVWARQLRWARLRRITFPWLFVPEILVGSAPPGVSAGLAAWGYGLSVVAAVATATALCITGEMRLAAHAGWHRSWRMPIALLVRDLLLPILWVGALLGSGFVWRGTEITIAKPRRAGVPPLNRPASEVSGS